MFTRLLHLMWPVPAVLVWALGWGVWWALVQTGTPPTLAAVVASLLATLWVVTSGQGWWRRALMGLGFPLSWALLQAGTGLVDAWVWLLPLAVLLLLYPPSTWKDAPIFPTPSAALDGLRDHAPLVPGAHVLDAGCGVGDGLLALGRAYPDARLHGIEHSAVLSLVCRMRCRGARIRRGDMWAQSWSDFDAVYLFQRPESMPRVWTKAVAEFKPGAYLLSLEFEVPDQTPVVAHTCPDGRPVWVYQPHPAQDD